MADNPKDTAQDLSKLVEQSVSTLQEVDRRLQMVRNDLANLITRAGTLQMHAQLQGPQGPGMMVGGEGMGMGMGMGGLPRPAIPGFGSMQGVPPMFGASPGPGAMGMGLGPAQGSPFAPMPVQGSPMSGGAPGGRSTKDLQHLPPLPRVPNVDLVDAGDEFLMQVELPGVKKEDLDILVSERTVTVTGQARPEVGEGALLLNERGPVVYRRLLPLPSEVHTTQSKAAFKDGILTLRVPKKVPTEGPRKVDVAYG